MTQQTALDIVESRLPWLCGDVECLACGTEWTAAWPVGAHDLECPGCGGTETDRTPNDGRRGER